MDFATFIEGPLLWGVFSIFLAGLATRFIFFLISIFKSKKNSPGPVNWKFILTALGKFLFPLHKAVARKPLYTILRYLFHIGLILVPIGYDGHITMLESSSLELSWPAIPDKFADWLTLMFIGLGVIFLARRIILPKVRRRSQAFDYVFITICLLPFLTGYFLAHGTLDSISFFSDNMQGIHIISSCIMIVLAVFLFLRSRLDVKTCTGCAACESRCPTGTLEFVDRGIQRIFHYSHYRCVSCGSCIASCPEDAAELRHEIGFLKFFQVLKKQEIRAVELKSCSRCGARFAPLPQLEKIGATIAEDYLDSCPKCKKINYANTFRQMLPWLKQENQPAARSEKSTAG